MANKKSIYEEALLDVKRIQEALNANTKEILRSVTREEIDGVVKESLQESDYEEEVVDDETETGDETGSEEETPVGDDSEEVATDDAEVEIDSDETGDTEIQASDEVGDDQDSGMDAPALDGDELDMTASSDDDIISIYKKLSGEDEIEIVGDEIHMNITEPGEYIVKQGSELPSGDAGLGDEGAGLDDEFEEIPTGGEGEEDFEEELTYEIAMDEETINENEEEEIKETVDETEQLEETETVAEEASEDEEVVEESIPVGSAQAHRLPGKANIGQPKGAGADNLKESKVTELTAKYNKVVAEAANLKKENEEFRKSLKEFRTKLIETVVFNSNLAYVTKLFMEHSTTKDEKKNIIKRFDEEVTNLKESKKLYKSIVNELTEKKPVNESVENKITKEVTTGSSKQLNEATAYVDPSTLRIRELINRVENR